MTQIAIAAAVNDHAILRQCLARSPDIASGHMLLKTYEGYATAGRAYNQALDDADADWIVLAHQDVYLPEGTLDRLAGALAELTARDPDWAVAGVIGQEQSGVLVGRTWSSGLGKLFGGEAPLPARVATLDEMLLIVRRSAGVRFDEDLPSFHLFGTDIVQTARYAGKSSWAIDLPVIHFSRPVINLGGGYRASWLYLRKKWKADLPLTNLVCPVTRSPLSIFLKDFRIRKLNRGRRDRGETNGDPAQIAHQLGLEKPA